VRISIQFLADTASFETNTKRASKEAERAAREMEAHFKRAGVVIGAALAAAATAVTALVAKSIKSAGDLNEMAQKVGSSAKELSTLQFAAQQSGVAIEALQTGMVKLAKNAADVAKNGVGPAADAFAALGISVKDQEGALKNSDVLLKEVAEQLSQYEDGANKTALAVAVFGKAGADMIPMLNEGATGIAALQEQARQLGLELSNETAQQAEEFGDKVAALGMVAQGLGNAIMEQVLPSLSGFAQGMIDSATEGDKFAAVAKALRTGMDFMLTVFIKGVEIVQNFTAVIGFLIEALTAMPKAVLEAVKSLGPFFEGMGAILDGDLSGAADKFREAMAKAAAVGPNLIASFKNAGTALKGSFAANAADAQRKLDAMAEASLDAAKATNEVGKQSKGAAPAMRDLAKEAANSEKAMKELEAREAAYVAMMQRAAEEQIDWVMKNKQAAAERQKNFERTAAELEREVELLGMTNAEREVALRRMEADNLARGENGNVVEAWADRYFDALTRAADAEKELQRQQENSALFERGFDALASALTDAFRRGGEGGFEALGDMLEDFAADLFNTKFVIPIKAAFQSGGVQGVMSGFQNNFGNGTGFRGTNGGMNWGNVGQFAGGAYGVYDAYRNGPGGGDGALAGAAAGAQAGMVFGPWGAAIGAIIGGLAGYFGGGEPTIRVSDRENDATARSRLDDVIGVARDRMEPGTATRFAEAIAAFDNQIAGVLDSYSGGGEQLERVRAALANWSIRVEGDAATIENVLTERFGDILATFSQDVQDFVMEADTLEERVSRLAEVLIRPDQIAAIFAALEEADLLAGMDDAGRALYALNKEFDAIRDELIRLAASEEELARVEEFRARAIERLNAVQTDANEITGEAPHTPSSSINSATPARPSKAPCAACVKNLTRRLTAPTNWRVPRACRARARKTWRASASRSTSAKRRPSRTSRKRW
jgi:hypothetical protein